MLRIVCSVAEVCKLQSTKYSGIWPRPQIVLPKKVFSFRKVSVLYILGCGFIRLKEIE